MSPQCRVLDDAAGCHLGAVAEDPQGAAGAPFPPISPQPVPGVTCTSIGREKYEGFYSRVINKIIYITLKSCSPSLLQLRVDSSPFPAAGSST